MKQSKKILALFLALMTLTTVLPAQAAGNTNQLIHQRFWTNKDMGIEEVTSSNFSMPVSICHTEKTTVIASGYAYKTSSKVYCKLKPMQDVISSVVGKNASGMIYGKKVAPRAIFGANSTAEIKYDSNCKQYWFGIQFWGTCFGSTTTPSYSTVFPRFK